MSATKRQLFLQHLAQTSEAPYLIEIDHAEGIYLYAPDGKAFVDLVSGVSVSVLGHSQAKIIEAIKRQLERHMHLHVYGEIIQESQVDLAAMLSDNLPEGLDCSYFVNSGSEAIEGALKLAKRYTGRFRCVAFRNAYHGGTAGALSMMGGETWKNDFRPLLPGTTFLEFNDFKGLENIDENTACVIIEPIQGEAGIILPEEGFLETVRDRCSRMGTLLIFDEVQTGIGRTGSLFAFEHWNVKPDILVLAKALGGGMPLGAFISGSELMSFLKKDPALGHITTFGGHPVSCAAAIANLELLLSSGWMEESFKKEMLFRELLIHPSIKEIRGKGLYLAIELGDEDLVGRLIQSALDEGLVSDSFLFHPSAFRISPPLIITEQQIREVCETLCGILDRLS